MSVIVKKDNDYFSYVKGSPEKILDLCKDESIPFDKAKVLDEYTRQGFRVIAAAYKPLPVEISPDTDRDFIESELNFLGFIIL
jgi:magnesium-transporting ATPase (P-type)